MVREIKDTQDARDWLDETLGMKGNDFLTGGQAKALDAFTDSLAKLVNEQNIHPVYLMGVLECMKLEVNEYARASVERAVEMAGGLECN